jgi:hypothetical protein
VVFGKRGLGGLQQAYAILDIPLRLQVPAGLALEPFRNRHSPCIVGGRADPEP